MKLWQSSGHSKTTRVAEQTNDLILKLPNPTQYFLSWVGNDGTTVNQVIDTEKNLVITVLTYDNGEKRVSQLLEGTFELK